MLRRDVTQLTNLSLWYAVFHILQLDSRLYSFPWQTYQPQTHAHIPANSSEPAV